MGPPPRPGRWLGREKTSRPSTKSWSAPPFIALNPTIQGIPRFPKRLRQRQSKTTHRRFLGVRTRLASSREDIQARVYFFGGGGGGPLRWGPSTRDPPSCPFAPRAGLPSPGRLRGKPPSPSRVGPRRPPSVHRLRECSNFSFHSSPCSGVSTSFTSARIFSSSASKRGRISSRMALIDLWCLLKTAPNFSDCSCVRPKRERIFLVKRSDEPSSVSFCTLAICCSTKTTAEPAPITAPDAKRISPKTKECHARFGGLGRLDLSCASVIAESSQWEVLCHLKEGTEGIRERPIQRDAEAQYKSSGHKGARRQR